MFNSRTSGTGARRAQPQRLHLWLHSLVISKAQERARPGLRPAHTAGTVTADQWVDDLESERWATTRGFESLRFRPSTSTNTDVLIIYRSRGDAGGCISGSNASPKVIIWLPSHRMVVVCCRGVLGAGRTLHLMAGGTPRHLGLGVRGGGFAWSAADPGPEICHV